MASLTLASLLSVALFQGGAASPLPSQASASNYPTRPNPSQLTWGPCPDPFESTPDVTCANYSVPIDWENPDENDTIVLGMIRIEARDKSRRIGNLFVNPGGPGGQATSLVSAIAQDSSSISDEILDHFDIIGLDPRGVGLSTPVQCDVAAYNKRVSFFPSTEDEYDELVAYNRAFGQSCRERTGRLLDFVDTISAARDHEAVRLALGGEKVSFVGLSYGTQLFSQYAELYPDGFRAMVLDGILEHSQSEASNLLIESNAYEATLKQFFAWCRGNDECAIAGQDAQTAYLAVLAKARQAPIPAPGCDDSPKTGCRSSVTEEEARFNVQGLVIRTAGWPRLAQALTDARGGNATLLSSAQPIAVGDAYEDSYLFGGAAIQCQDWSHGADSLAAVQEKQILGATFSPLTRGACQSYRIQTSCIGWPAPLSNPERALSYDGDAKILMVNSIYDPSTSFVWAAGLKAELGENAVLLTRNGTGHTSWRLGGATTDAENAYLLNLTLPEPGTILDS